jgi:2-polyprenyl-3-methyl-5-hydroxy-6-metoxy-1,4-benzoquinol methylase
MHARITFETCPLCAGDEATEVAIADCSRHPLYKPLLPASMRWLRCDRCQHIFVDGYFSEEALAVLFSDTQPMQVPGHEVGQARLTWSKVIAEVARFQTGLGGRWLDVGFGSGALLTTAAEFGYETVGLDLRADSVERMQRFGYEAFGCDLSQYQPSAPFDVVSFADVLEHMPDPLAALGRAHEIMKPSGLLFASMPNFDAFVWKVLDARGENPYWAEIEHLHNFGRARLYALLRQAGFEPCCYGVSERYVACMEVIARWRAPA